MKRRARPAPSAAGLLLAILAFASCHVPQNYLAPDAPKFRVDFAIPAAPVPATIKVVTYNLAHARRIGRALSDLSTLPSLSGADILLLQEMDAAGTERIARALSCNYVYYPAAIHPRDRRQFGNAILTKWPISGEAKILLPHRNPLTKMRRIAVTATVWVGADPVSVYCTHLETILLRNTKKLHQAQALIAHAASLPQSRPVITGGDFNMVGRGAMRKAAREFAAAGFTWASEQVGPTFRNFLALDHIFARGFRVKAAGRVARATASDHSPVWVILEKKSLPAL